MKRLIILATLSLVLQLALSCSGNELRLFNLEYPKDDSNFRFSFNYSNMTIKHHVLVESDYQSTVFKFIWNYSNDEEKEEGHKLLEQIGADFEEIREDYGFLLVFFGKDIKALKYYRESEFGRAYTIEAEQKGHPFTMQLQLKPNQPNQEEFHKIITSLTDKETPLKFLE